jgi:hypothetical protein
MRLPYTFYTIYVYSVHSVHSVHSCCTMAQSATVSGTSLQHKLAALMTLHGDDDATLRAEMKKMCFEKRNSLKAKQDTLNAHMDKLFADNDSMSVKSFKTAFKLALEAKQEAKKEDKKEKPMGQYQAFVKERLPVLKMEHGDLDCKDLMRIIGDEWQVKKTGSTSGSGGSSSNIETVGITVDIEAVPEVSVQESQGVDVEVEVEVEGSQGVDVEGSQGAMGRGKRTKRPKTTK